MLHHCLSFVHKVLYLQINDCNQCFTEKMNGNKCVNVNEPVQELIKVNFLITGWYKISWHLKSN